MMIAPFLEQSETECKTTNTAMNKSYCYLNEARDIPAWITHQKRHDDKSTKKLSNDCQ